MGKLEEAIAAYDTAVKMNPKNKNAELNRDNCIVALKMHCEKYKKKPSTKIASDYVSKSSSGQGGQGVQGFPSTTSPYETRLAALTEALNVNPGDVLAYCNRAAIYLKMGKGPEFENDVQWAIKSLSYGDIKNLSPAQKSFLVQFLMQYSDVLVSLKDLTVSHNFSPEEKNKLQK